MLRRFLTSERSGVVKTFRWRTQRNQMDDFIGPENRAAFDSIRDADGDLPPPWHVFPHYRPTSMGWRMGTGEVYMCYWHQTLNQLPPESRRAYRRKFPAPMYWFWAHYNLESVPVSIFVAIFGLLTWPVRFFLHILYRTCFAPRLKLPW